MEPAPTKTGAGWLRREVAGNGFAELRQDKSKRAMGPGRAFWPTRPMPALP